MATHSSILAWRIPTVHATSKRWTRLKQQHEHHVSKETPRAALPFPQGSPLGGRAAGCPECVALAGKLLLLRGCSTRHQQSTWHLGEGQGGTRGPCDTGSSEWWLLIHLP